MQRQWVSSEMAQGSSCERCNRLHHEKLMSRPVMHGTSSTSMLDSGPHALPLPFLKRTWDVWGFTSRSIKSSSTYLNSMNNGQHAMCSGSCLNLQVFCPPYWLMVKRISYTVSAVIDFSYYIILLVYLKPKKNKLQGAENN